MAIIHSPKAEGKFERRQVARLTKRGIYGGLLSHYTEPKKYATKYGEKEQMVFRFVVTHDQAYRQLPKFSSAFVKVTNVISEKSNLVAVLYALFGGKKTREEIVAGDGVYDYDTFIARPVSLFLQPYETPDKDGLYGNLVKSVEPADDEMRKALRPLYEARVVKTNEKSFLHYLASPTEEYEEGAPASVSGSADNGFDDESWPDEP